MAGWAMLNRAFLLTLVLLGVLGGWQAGAWASPMTPVYLSTFLDAVTGDAPNPQIASDGKWRWTIDPGADSYQNDFYERPTAQEYKVYTVPGGGKIFAAKEYFEYLDIVQAKAGFDSQYLYVAIDLFGRNKHTEDNVKTPVGLVERYGFRIGKNPTNPGSKGGFLLVADQPELKNSPNTTFGRLGTFGYKDSDNDVGGTGISITKQDNPSQVNGNGYDQVVISDGRTQSGQDVLFVRIDPADPTIVEFAFDYNSFGFSQADLSTLTYFEFEANKGTKDPQNYLWNDEYTKSEAGSPYRATSGDLSKSEFGTQGLGNIYELDTLRSGGIAEPILEPVIPEPGTLLLLGSGLVGLSGLAWKRRRRK